MHVALPWYPLLAIPVGLWGARAAAALRGSGMRSNGWQLLALSWLPLALWLVVQLPLPF